MQQSSGESRRDNADACLAAVIARSESDAAIQSHAHDSGLLPPTRKCASVDAVVASLLAQQ
jgi:hypothetical protein